MKNKKRLVALLTAVIICFTLLQPAFAAELSTNDKASALNKISILRGDGKDFNLTGKLKRSEAAAFIVRALGKETYMYMNENKYMTTKFSDVQGRVWYVPYIAYCVEQKIIGGYPNGKFGPDDYISEKAFLKIILGALGYKENVDFTWNNIYQVAYNVGIVTDSKYQTLSADNTQYTRGEVVKALFNAMTEPNKETGVQLVQGMIDAKAVTKDKVLASGIIVDTLVTAIDSVNVVNASRITLKLNEKIKNITNSEIQIFERDNAANKLNATIESQTDGQITINTAPQVGDKDYIINLTLVEDIAGNKMSNISKEFKGYKAIELKSDFFKISKVEAVSKSVINVFFTQPINSNIELPMYYEIMEGSTSYVKGTFSNMSVKTLGAYNNAVTIFLKDKNLQDGAPYTLKVSGDVTSLYAVKLNDGTEGTAYFTGVGTENEDFYVTDVVPLDNSSMIVYFNREVDSLSAQQRTNYDLKDSNNVPRTVGKAILLSDGDAKGKAVKLSIVGTFDETRIYELTVKNLQDGIRQNTIKESKHGLAGAGLKKQNLEIINVVAEDKETVSVYLNKPLNTSSVANNVLYTLSSDGYMATPSKVYYDYTNNPYQVKLYLTSGTALTSSKSYKLSISSVMQDDLGATSSANAEFTFTGNDSSNIKPMMYEAMIIGKDTIRVRFTEEVALDAPNNIPSNYTLEYKEGTTAKTKVANSISFVDATTMIVKFESLDNNTSYTFKFNQLKDYSGNNTRTAADELNTLGVSVGTN